jgi:alkaline phosphatase D
MDTLSFAHWLVDRYRTQLSVKSFAALLRAMPADGRVHSIWDDHDFLWNDACGAQEAQRPEQVDKIALSTAAQTLWREALSTRLAGPAFPSDGLDERLWPQSPRPLATPSIALAPDLWLHLSDGRTWRTDDSIFGPPRRALLGSAQRKRLAEAYAAAPAGAVHLFASGSTFAGYKRYEEDSAWLLGQAAARRTLLLSGDIHRNEFDAFHTGGFPLHEATSSGAAVKLAVVVGPRRENYGLVDVDESSVRVRLFDKDGLQDERVIDRARWLPR